MYFAEKIWLKCPKFVIFIINLLSLYNKQRVNSKTVIIMEQVFDLINEERARQMRGIELIASENFVSDQVMQAMGSVLTN